MYGDKLQGVFVSLFGAYQSNGPHRVLKRVFERHIDMNRHRLDEVRILDFTFSLMLLFKVT